jgi:hypothetical protein
MGFPSGDLTLWLIAGPLLVGWFAIAWVAVTIARVLGLPGQPVLAAVAVAFFVTFWAVGLWALFGGSDDGEQPT